MFKKNWDERLPGYATLVVGKMNTLIKVPPKEIKEVIKIILDELYQTLTNADAKEDSLSISSLLEIGSSKVISKEGVISDSLYFASAYL